MHTSKFSFKALLALACLILLNLQLFAQNKTPATKTSIMIGYGERVGDYFPFVSTSSYPWGEFDLDGWGSIRHLDFDFKLGIVAEKVYVDLDFSVVPNVGVGLFSARSFDTVENVRSRELTFFAVELGIGRRCIFIGPSFEGSSLIHHEIDENGKGDQTQMDTGAFGLLLTIWPNHWRRLDVKLTGGPTVTGASTSTAPPPAAASPFHLPEHLVRS